MARLKEQSRVERERRHLEKASKRKLQEEDEAYVKKPKVEELPVVTVSDNSDPELGEVYEDDEDKSDVSGGSPPSSKRSRSVSRHSADVSNKN